jgi:hypothetical protein
LEKRPKIRRRYSIVFKSRLMRTFLFISLVIFILLLNAHYRLSLDTKNRIAELIQTGNEYLNIGNYNEAVSAYSIALNLKDDSSVRTQLNLARKYLNSERSFQIAMNAYEKEDYISARKHFLNVISVDEERYSIAMEVMENISTLIAEQYLKNAEEFFANKNYIKAHDQLMLALKENPDFEEAASLKITYTTKYQEQLDIQKKEAEAARKRREEQQEAEKQRLAEEQRQKEIDKMMRYETGKGSVSIAVKVEISETFLGYSSKDKKSWFVKVFINSKNLGNSLENVSDTHFTLATPNGYIVPPSELTYASFNELKPFKEINLQPNTYSSGWLIFFVPKAENYILYFDNGKSKVEKKIVW